MDRIVSDEERIRRAEEIVERRNNEDLRISSNSFVKEKSSTKIRKILIQILICLILYCGIYYIKNSKNEKFNSLIGNINKTLEYDVDFKKIYNEICTKLNNLNTFANGQESEFEDKQGEENTNNNAESELTENSNYGDNNANQTEENTINNENSVGQLEENINEINMGIGGEFNNESDGLDEIDADQMVKDADYVLKKISIVNPLECGTVTSRFGNRNSSSIVSGNHKGIDLGAQIGSSIIAASDGKVVKASSEGDFGTHLKIQYDDIVMIYAHCSKLLVNEGDIISKGQQIAEVGATGKATGPHLHFEIRRENRAINPELLLEF